MLDYSYLAPPIAAYNIVHTDYYIKHNDREKGARKIYETVQYDQFEMEKIKELKDEITRSMIKLPSDWKESDYLKIGYSGRFKMKEVIKKLQLHLSWRANKIYHEINSATEKFLKDGICYVFGRDKQYRPIVILNAHLIDLKKYDKETIIQALSFMMGIIRKHMFIPGKVENWLFILESNGLGVFGLPVKALQVVIDTMSTNFGGCLEKMFILNPSSGLNFLWKTISGFLDPETAQKINFYQQKDFKKLLELIDPKQLELKYGGEQQNQQNFWPPYNLDLVDGYSKMKADVKLQDIQQQQEIQFHQRENEDPYDNVEFNVHDFLETQKKLYSYDYKPAPVAENRPEPQPEHMQQTDNEAQKINTQLVQDQERQTPEIIPEQQVGNDLDAIQQQQEHPFQEEEKNQNDNQFEQNQPEKIDQSQTKHDNINPQEADQGVKVNEEAQLVSNASATKIPIEVQGQCVEISKVDPVANNAACCKGCLIF